MVLDRNDLNAALIQFGCALAKFSHAKLIAMFTGRKNAAGATREHDLHAFGHGYHVQPAIGHKRSICEQTIAQFQLVCIKAGVLHKILEPEDPSIEAVLQQSRYADVMLVTPWLACGTGAPDIPSQSVRNLLMKSECPVMIASEPPFEINHLVFCFDEGRSSILAIKQFTYLFPHFRSCKATLFQVKTGDEENTGQEPLFMEWLKTNYAHTHFLRITGRKEEQLMNYLINKKHTMVIMGAYGRNAFSHYLQKSTADQPIKFLELPFFIAHQ